MSDLEFAIAQLAKREAGKHGVTIESVGLNFRELGPRAIAAEATVPARKIFFATTVRVTGQLEIDEQLTATISNQNCAGEGAIGSVASGFLAPQLAKLNGQRFPLTALVGDKFALRDVHLAAGERLTVTAQFAA